MVGNMPLEGVVTIPLDEDDVEELAALAKNCDKLPELLSKSAQVNPRTGTIPISRQLSEKIGLDVSVVHSMVNGLVRIFRMRDGLSATGEAVAKTIACSLEKANQPDAMKAWKDAQAKIVQACDMLSAEHPLLVSYEAGYAVGSIPTPEVIEFSERHGILSYVAEAKKLAEQCFPSRTALDICLDDDPEEEGQWIVVEVTMEQDANDFLKAYNRCISLWSERIPTEALALIRLSYNLA